MIQFDPKEPEYWEYQKVTIPRGIAGTNFYWSPGKKVQVVGMLFQNGTKYEDMVFILTDGQSVYHYNMQDHKYLPIEMATELGIAGFSLLDRIAIPFDGHPHFELLKTRLL